MSIIGRIRPMSTDEEERARLDAAVREARVAAARKQAGWTEIVPAERLIPRGPKRFGWLVDSESDSVFVLAPGTVFDRGTLIADRVEGLSFYVDGDGDVRVLERLRSPATWSEVVRTHPDLAASADA